MVVGTLHQTGCILFDCNSDFVIARINSDGSLDNSFSGDGKLRSDFDSDGNEWANAVALQPDGKIIVVGGSTKFFDIDMMAVARYNPDGSRDNTFAGGGEFVYGYPSKEDANRLFRLRQNGSFDEHDGWVVSDFDQGDDRAYALLTDYDGKIIVAGETSENLALARYNSQGTLDPSFGDNGQIVTNGGKGRAANRDSSDRIVVAGFTNEPIDFGVWRFISNGKLDTSFNGSGFQDVDFGGREDYGQAMLVQDDEKIVVVGYSRSGTDNKIALTRLQTNGTLDPTFSNDGKELTDPGSSSYLTVRAAAMQPDGKIVVVGGWDGNFLVTRYNADGSLDPGFGGVRRYDLGGNDEARAVAIFSSGRIVVAGYTSGDFGLLFLESFGDRCLLFCAPNGQLITEVFGDVSAYDIHLQPDGKILVAGGGNASDPSSYSQYYAVRYYLGGLPNQKSYRLDTSFGDGGIVKESIMGRSIARAIAIDTNDDILLAGFIHNGSEDDFALVCLIGPNAQPPQFISSNPPGKGQVGTYYSYTFKADGYPPPLFKVSEGSLPPGLTLGAYSGQLSGVPIMPGNYVFYISADNGVGSAKTQELTIKVQGFVYLPLLQH